MFRPAARDRLDSAAERAYARALRHEEESLATRLAIAAAAALAVLAAPSVTAPAPAALSVVWAEPTQGGKIAAQRVGAANAGEPQRWRVNLDVAVKNTGRRLVTLVKSQVCYPGVGILCLTSTLGPEDRLRIPAGGTEKVVVRENREHAFPVAPAIRVVLYFEEEGGRDDLAVIVQKSVAQFQSAVSGGYLFPGRKADLPENWYWGDNQSQLVGSNHRKSTGQRFAYDFGVRRWNGKEWTSRHPGKDGTANSHYLIWGLPVYAMADGWILRCARTIDDNPKPGIKGDGGGNSFIIVHADGEVALYAHFRKNSIPRELCPVEAQDITERRAVKVKAGQFLGRAGNSGQSSGPHLHVHIASARTNGQGLPLQFRNVRTRFAGSIWNESRPCDRKTPSFAATTVPVAVGWRQLVDPLWPSGRSELSRSAVREPCFQDVADGAVAAGYRPFWFDGYDVDGKAYVNAVFRPGGGEWVLRSNLSAAGYQSELSNWVSRGYVPSLVESYQSSGSVHYAFLAEKRGNAGIDAWHGRSPADQERLADAAQGRGRVPVAIAVISRGGKLLYTAFWEKKDIGAWRYRTVMTSSEYQAWLNEQAAAGRRLVYLNAYHHAGKARFSAIVSSKAPASYAARHDLPGPGLQSEYEKWTGQGRRTQLVTGYNAGKSHRFAALWR